MLGVGLGLGHSHAQHPVVGRMVPWFGCISAQSCAGTWGYGTVYAALSAQEMCRGATSAKPAFVVVLCRITAACCVTMHPSGPSEHMAVPDGVVGQHGHFVQQLGLKERGGEARQHGGDAVEQLVRFEMV